MKPLLSVGEHEFYCCGAQVRVKDGTITLLTPPRISHCPLHEALYGTETIDRDAVIKSVERKIQDVGFCCADRLFDDTLVVPYGSSEIISVCMKQGLLDCAVTVCDGAGTVIADRPELVQAIGARLTGIIKTSPIPQTIEYIQSKGGIVIDEGSAQIDQYGGILKAADQGHRRIAVTVASFYSDHIQRIRAAEKTEDLTIALFSVCNTCADENAIDRIQNGADVVCAGASQLVRDAIGSRALIQLGVAIPVFALTKRGKTLLLSYLMEFTDNLVAFRTRKMPYVVKGKGPVMK